jgi:hypothetical protein
MSVAAPSSTVHLHKLDLNDAREHHDAPDTFSPASHGADACPSNSDGDCLMPKPADVSSAEELVASKSRVPSSSASPWMPWTLPSQLTREDVEGWVLGLPDGASEVTLHIGAKGCKSGPGAAASLQSALCLLQRNGVRTRLSMPPTTFADDRALHLFERTNLKPAAEDTSALKGTPAERTLASHLAGLFLAQLCEPGAGASETLALLRRRQAQVLDRDRNLFGAGRSRAVAVIGATDHRTRLQATERVRRAQVEDRILTMLGTSAYHPSQDAHGLMKELVEFVYQASENTFDHGRHNFDGDVIRQVRTISLERVIVGDGAGAQPVATIAPDSSSFLRAYLERAQCRLERAGGDPERLHLWSATVADGGVGIAGRMLGSLDAYDAPLADELALVQEAVFPDATSNPYSRPGRGAGLTKMMRATHRLGGLFEIRSGRLALTRSYLQSDGTSRDVNFYDPHGGAFTLAGGADEHVMLAGTVVSVLFPAIDLSPGSGPGIGRRRPLLRTQPEARTSSSAPSGKVGQRA